jgi:hypothetical protein
MVLKVTKQTTFLKRQISRITVQRIKFAHILDQQTPRPLMVNIATRSSVEEFWAHVVNYQIRRPNYQYKFKVQRYSRQAKVKRFFFWSYTRDLLTISCHI